MLISERIYTVKEAAAETRLSPWSLWDYLKKGVIRRTKIGGKTFIRESELLKLIKEN
jgi:hypothetical protein